MSFASQFVAIVLIISMYGCVGFVFDLLIIEWGK